MVEEPTKSCYVFLSKLILVLIVDYEVCSWCGVPVCREQNEIKLFELARKMQTCDDVDDKYHKRPP